VLVGVRFIFVEGEHEEGKQPQELTEREQKQAKTEKGGAMRRNLRRYYHELTRLDISQIDEEKLE